MYGMGHLSHLFFVWYGEYGMVWSDLDPLSTQYVIDCMAHVHCEPTEGLSTFGPYVDRYCQSIFRLPGSRIDVVMDRYDTPSIKDQKRTMRAKKVK